MGFRLPWHHPDGHCSSKICEESDQRYGENDQSILNDGRNELYYGYYDMVTMIWLTMVK